MPAKSNLVLDVVIAVAFLVASNPPLTGLAVHEWLGVSFAVALVVHLLFHWNWIAHVTRRVFRTSAGGSRLNYAVNALLFVALTATVLSGLLISKHLLATLGLPTTPRPAWREIHSVSANTVLAALGVHIGLHWNWLAFHLAHVLGIRHTTAAAGGAVPRRINASPAQPLAAGGAKS
jgi:hypothetical protein